MCLEVKMNKQARKFEAENIDMKANPYVDWGYEVEEENSYLGEENALIERSDDVKE
jgi:hypothetical protein